MKAPSLAVLLAALPGLVAAPGVARADHTADERVISETPFTLRPGEVSIGLTSIDVGLGGHPLLERFDVGTNPWLWGANMFGLRAYNGHVKYEHYRDDHLSLSTAAGFTRFSVPGASLTLVPIEAFGAVMTGDLTFVLGGTYTSTLVRGDMSLTEDVGAFAEAGVSSVVGKASTIYRRSQRTAYILAARVLASQVLESTAGAGGEMIEGGAAVRADLAPADLAYSVAGSVHWSWPTFNLELGLRYGNQSIPWINMVTSARFLMPFADLYWRI